MACKHKFHSDLNLENLDYEPEILIIGTFNPEWALSNDAEWFYGRTRNNYFWDVVPRILGKKSLRKNATVSEWKNFCKENKIAITDLITSIDDADKSNVKHFEIISKYKDSDFNKYFNKINFTDIVKILHNNHRIKKIYITREKGEKLFDQEIRKIIDYSEKNNIFISYMFTTSANARFQMKNYTPRNIDLERNLPNFIYEKWLEKWNN